MDQLRRASRAAQFKKNGYTLDRDAKGSVSSSRKKGVDLAPGGNEKLSHQRTARSFDWGS